jgi:hypothetical protein
MNFRSVLIVSLVAMLVACSPPMVSPRAAIECPGSSCDVVVKVTGDIAAGTAAIVAVPDVRVKKGNRNPVLRWNLEAPGYEFRDGSIEPKPASASDWAEQCKVVAARDEFVLATNKNSRRVEMGYAIHIWHVQTGKRLSLDPVIFNDGL